MTVIRCGTDDAAHRGQETHVGHAVGFIDDDGRDRGEVEGTLFQHVFEAARASDDDVDAKVKGLAGDVVRGATVNADHPTTTVISELSDLFLNLGGQFTGRHQDQAGRFARTGLSEASHERKTEGQGLSRTSRGLSDDVAAGEGVGQRGLLDGEGFRDSASIKTLYEVRRHTEVGKGHGHMTPTS